MVYNAGLIVAGMAALTFYAAALELAKCQGPELEIAPLTLVYQALGYMAAMALANLLYSLGPVAESWLKPARVDTFRRWVFGSGFATSCALPLVAPLLYLVRCR